MGSMVIQADCSDSCLPVIAHDIFMPKVKEAIIGLIVTAVVTSSGYGAIYLADNRYLRQDTWVAENRRAQRESLQYQIDKLEFLQEKGKISDIEKWELKRLKSQLRELDSR